MKQLNIDIETFSEADIKNVGLYKYTESPGFEIMLFGYSVDGAYADIIDLACGETIPQTIFDALFDPSVIKTAYNAAFEITCLNAHFGITLDPLQWSCTQALAARAGLPFGLDTVAKVLKNQTQKDASGKTLIKYFSMPCKPTTSNGQRTRNLPQHDTAKWQAFKDYCVNDVLTEMEIRASVLSWYAPSTTLPVKAEVFENNLWALDLKINALGVRIDKTLVDSAIFINAQEEAIAVHELKQLTSLDNPNSDAQIKSYILASTGISIASLNKEAMPDVLKSLAQYPDALHVLALRQKLSRSSNKKFEAMAKSVCGDGHVKGLFQYYGANRTGRWAGRNVQLQNLVRNNLDNLDSARDLVKARNVEGLSLLYDDIGKVLSNLIRSAFIPAPGHVLVVSDLSAIEARVIAWLAGEKWRIDVFASHGKIYEASASMMFNIPLSDITKDLRQKGKVAELALGYQGAVGALERMGGKAMGLTEDDMKRIVALWRKASPAIVRLWRNCENAIKQVIDNLMPIKLEIPNSSGSYCAFYIRGGNLFIQLPSGRPLVYHNIAFNGKSITYYGMDQIKKIWCRQDTYGGKIVENIVQAIARDVLANALVEADKQGLILAMHVHDEIVAEAPIADADKIAETLNTILSAEVSWAKGLKLGAETFITNYYTK